VAVVTALAAILFVVLTLDRRLAAVLAAALAGSAILTAVQIAPYFELLPRSIANFRQDWFGQGGGIPIQALVSLVAPNHYGQFNLATYHQPYDISFMYLYCGLLTLPLALTSLITVRSRIVWIFAALLLVFGIAMLGDYTPISRALYALIPKDTRAGMFPEFAIPVFILSLAALAAIGANRIPWRLQWIALAICAVDLIATGSGRPMNTTRISYDPGITRNSFEGQPETALHVRALSRQLQPPARIEAIDNSLGWAMAAPTMRIPAANGNDLLAPERSIYARLAFSKGERWGSYYEPQNLSSPVLGMMNVRYLLARNPIQNPGPFVPVAEVPGFQIYENTSVMPRFWLVSGIRPASSEDEASALLRSPDFKPSEEAIVERAPHFENSGGTPTGAVNVLRYGLKDFTLEIEVPQTSYLATSETHYPGWRAWIDGAEQNLYYTNLAFRGTVIPAGKHVVRMAFEPPSLKWCGLLSLAAWLAWLGLWWTKAGWRIVKE
jgi:hypothetical protein